ncbi:hypothetical protein AB5N19_06547 [Seiridium cardinale]|uniref:Uncharacterized protein n=1 Tax=Seiridium cardinale TaxID=138064 RepID=A0ABR2XZ95_9PEZI
MSTTTPSLTLMENLSPKKPTKRRTKSPGRGVSKRARLGATRVSPQVPKGTGPQALPDTSKLGKASATEPGNTNSSTIRIEAAQAISTKRPATSPLKRRANVVRVQGPEGYRQGLTPPKSPSNEVGPSRITEDISSSPAVTPTKNGFVAYPSSEDEFSEIHQNITPIPSSPASILLPDTREPDFIHNGNNEPDVVHSPSPHKSGWTPINHNHDLKWEGVTLPKKPEVLLQKPKRGLKAGAGLVWDCMIDPIWRVDTNLILAAGRRRRTLEREQMASTETSSGPARAKRRAIPNASRHRRIVQEQDEAPLQEDVLSVESEEEAMQPECPSVTREVVAREDVVGCEKNTLPYGFESTSSKFALSEEQLDLGYEDDFACSKLDDALSDTE